MKSRGYSSGGVSILTLISKRNARRLGAEIEPDTFVNADDPGGRASTPVLHRTDAEQLLFRRYLRKAREVEQKTAVATTGVVCPGGLLIREGVL